MWEVIFAKYAAPGMCNPADAEPCTSGTPTQAQIDNDDRTLAQRQHDAMLVVGRIALMSGELGHLNGLPVSVIIRTTLQDLESRAGIGVTGGGTKLPIADVIRMGAHAHHHLAVFDKATGQALALYRTKARGLSRPADHADRPRRRLHQTVLHRGRLRLPGPPRLAGLGQGGNTNVDDLTLACGPDNRAVDDGGWQTTINTRGECEWTPPPALDHGQTRINYYHRPEALLRPPEDQAPPEPTQLEFKRHNDTHAEPEHLDPTETPGGPGPPDNQAA